MLVLITFGIDTCFWLVIGQKGNGLINTEWNTYSCFVLTICKTWFFALLNFFNTGASYCSVCVDWHSLLKYTLFYIATCMMLSSAFPLLAYCSKNACTYITNPCILKKVWLCIETRQRRCVESVYEERPHRLSFDTKLSYTTTSDIGLNPSALSDERCSS
jgi:hypothetical protein